MSAWPTPDETALAAEVRRVLERSCPREDLRSHLPADPDAPRAQHELGWKHLAGQLGVAGLAAPEALGGAGADVGALAVVAEEIGRAVAAVPFLSTVLSVDVLARAQKCAAAAGVLPQIAEGRLAVALAAPLDGPASGVVAEPAGVGWALRGTVAAVVDGLAAELLIVAADAPDGPAVFLVQAGGKEVTRRQLKTLDLGRPQAAIELAGAGAERLDLDDAAEALRRARRLARVLLAAEQCGLAARVLELAVEYAKTREQFGRPIGSFQAVKHLCADLYAQTELARALLTGAVQALRADDRAGDGGAAATRMAVQAAAIGCAESAAAVTAGAVQVFGGIGFTWEHDAHLFFRRARANAVLAGPTSARKATLAELLAAGDGLADGDGDGADPEIAEIAGRGRRWFAEHAERKSSARGGTEEAEARHIARARAHRGALADAGLAGITVPVEHGGAGLSIAHEDAVARAARGYDTFDDVFGIGTGMCVPVLLTLGTAEQKARYVAPLLRGEQIWCQLFSEPGAGSDLASLRTKAVRDGDEWVVTGQKVWTTYAQHSDLALMLARTDPDAPKHKGITMFVVDMKAAGITARPLRQITGDAEFNEVFLDDVRLPADAVVGEVDGGWRAATVMLMNERVTIGRDPLTMSPPVTFDRLRGLVLDAGLAQDPVAGAQLADVYVLERSLALLGGKIAQNLRPGEDPGPFASISKLGAAHLARLTTQTAFALAGPAAAAWDAGDSDAGVWAYSLLYAPALGIAGGTDQIQRTIIGERLLGLPKG